MYLLLYIITKQNNLNFNNQYFSTRTSVNRRIFMDSFYRRFNNLITNKIEWLFIVKQIKNNGDYNVNDWVRNLHRLLIMLNN